jgi:hypothetical protein
MEREEEVKVEFVNIRVDGYKLVIDFQKELQYKI